MNLKLHELVKEIGGPDRITQILKVFYGELARDVMVGFFFEGFNLDSIATMQSQFILRSAGWRSDYSGRTPDRAHDKLAPILPGHFDRRIQILKSVLANEGLTQIQTEVWIEFEEAFRKLIVKPHADCLG